PPFFGFSFHYSESGLTSVHLSCSSTIRSSPCIVSYRIVPYLPVYRLLYELEIISRSITPDLLPPMFIPHAQTFLSRNLRHSSSAPLHWGGSIHILFPPPIVLTDSWWRLTAGTGLQGPPRSSIRLRLPASGLSSSPLLLVLCSLAHPRPRDTASYGSAVDAPPSEKGHMHGLGLVADKGMSFPFVDGFITGQRPPQSKPKNIHPLSGNMCRPFPLLRSPPPPPPPPPPLLLHHPPPLPSPPPPYPQAHPPPSYINNLPFFFFSYGLHLGKKENTRKQLIEN
ncbi:hypothetical protein L249_5153, partial [Ophiocordyceps polyrhachis-furcata BCC 54312]